MQFLTELFKHLLYGSFTGDILDRDLVLLCFESLI